MVFIFGALLEFAIVNSLMRQANKFEHLANCVSRKVSGRRKYRQPMTKKIKRCRSSKIGNKPIVYAQHDYMTATKFEEEEESDGEDEDEEEDVEEEEEMQTKLMDNHRQRQSDVLTNGSCGGRPV